MPPDDLLRLIDQAAAEGWKTLDLSGNDLTELPPEIGQLTQLETLILGKRKKRWVEFIGNRLKTLPAEIGQLTNLKTLLVEGNQLKSLPVEIGRLKQLRILMVGENQLSELPKTFKQLTELRVLVLDKNKFTSIPIEIAQLSKLKTLRFWQNSLEGIFNEIAQLTALQSLYLSRNQLSGLPPEIGQLTALQSLDLSFNQLSGLPPEIGQLTALRSLYLSRNQLSGLPPEIAQLTALQSLDLGFNQLSGLPPEIGQLTALQSLDLFINQLSGLPPEIGQLTALQSLYLSDNQLSGLPPEIGQLTALQSLYLSRNQLSGLPPEIGQLTALQSLDLSFNQLSGLPPEIAQLTALRSLSLGFNQLSGLPPEIAQLTDLEKLDLSGNQLSGLPPEIAQLTALQSLSLSSNQLSGLPPEIAQLTDLEKLDLRGNPIPIPPEILGPKETWQDPGNLTEILDFYFQTLDPDESEPLYEAKLLIVGEGGAGKTTLAKKIDNANYELQPEEKSTEGIDVVRWDFEHSNGETFRANIWDFGGQEIYHATHQFFLTKRSLYAVVVDSRQNNVDLYYWLNLAKLYGGGSPVFIIKNEKQDRPCQVNDRQLRSEFTNLKEPLRTNLKTNRGLDEIKAKIRQYITHLPHVGTPLPKIWVRVRACLENYSQNCNYIPIEKYYDLCEQNHFQDREQMLSLSRYLHDLGVCLHFHQDPLLKKILILKPEWGTTAVYKALDTKEVKDNMGRFSRAQLNEIWSDSKYADMQGELLQLMLNFKLCYPIPGSDNEYIAPQLLDIEQPEYDWDDTNNLLLRYHYDFMPKGIVTRFIVEMHRFIEQQKLVWKSGVVLNNGSARAEVIEYYHKGEIHIRASGVNCREFLTVVSHELDSINSSYENLGSRKLIPCVCSSCENSSSPFLYPAEILYRFVADRQYRIQCQESFEMVDVRSLLFRSEVEVRSDKEAESWATQTESFLTELDHTKNQFRERIREQGSSFLSEARVLILGEPGTGKTTLFKKIEDPNYIVPNEEDPTLGININSDWNIPASEEYSKTIRCSIWDFGGHEIQSYIHHIFLSKSSLYVLVVDDRKQNTEFDYWFNIVSSFGERASVLVVLNEINCRFISSFDLSYYREKFPGLIIEKREVDFSSNDYRIEALIDKMKSMLINLEHLKKETPAIWALIRYELQKIYIFGRDHIAFSEYKSVCENYGIKHEKEQLDLSQHLHDLGSILHFQHDPNLFDFLALNPKWIIEAVYEIVSEKGLIEKGGKFSRGWLFSKWDEKGYSREEMCKLLNLMKRNKFDLCYQISSWDSAKDEYIIPHLLSNIKPKYNWNSEDNLRFRLCFSFMPRGILSQLIVRLSHYLVADSNGKTLVWKRGAIFTQSNTEVYQEEHFTFAEVIDTLDDKGIRVIDIRISGKDSKDQKSLLTAIRKEILEICKKIGDITYDEKVPCNCNFCKADIEPYLYDLHHLRRMLEKKIKKVRCRDSLDEVLIEPLIAESIDRAGQNLSQEVRLSSKDQRKERTRKRAGLFEQVSNLPDTQFKQLVFALSAPQENIGGDSAAQGERANNLLVWAESPLGCGLQDVEDVLTSFFHKNDI
jgi:internalin A